MNLYGMTDIGKKRHSNQDVFYTHKFSEQVGFAVVCDGMGGQNGGQVASNITCSTISKELRLNELSNGKTVKEMVISAISEANVTVYRTSIENKEYKGMGTTAVVAAVVNDTAHIANIGDSRVYKLSGDSFEQITKDHSLVQELIEQGKLTKEEGRNHPNKNMITRAVGVNLTVNIDYVELKFEKCEKILLCSDGLTNMVDDLSIKEVLSENDAKTACEKLIKMANDAGGIDNITVAVIE